MAIQDLGQVDTINCADNVRFNQDVSSAQNLAYSKLTEAELCKHALKQGARGFARFTIFGSDGSIKESGTPNLVLLSGREYLAQKLSGVPQPDGVDYRDYEIRYFGFGRGGSQDGTGTVPNKIGPFDDDKGLYAPAHFASGSSDRDSQFKYIHNGTMKRIRSSGGTINLVQENHIIKKNDGEVSVDKYTAIKYTMFIDNHEFLKPSLEGTVTDLPFPFNEAALYAVKTELVKNTPDENGVETYMELPYGLSDTQRQSPAYIPFARFTTATKWMEKGDSIKIEWFILV